MNDHPALERIQRRPIFAAVRAHSADSALKSAQAAVDGGLELLEIRLTTPGAYRVISDLRREHGDTLLVGAGAVATTEMADRAIKSGAQFIIAPHTDEDTVALCRERGLLTIPGAITPSEVMRAWTIGSPIVSVFPVVPFGGAAYVKTLTECFEDVRLMPAGGVSADNMRDLFRAGAYAVTIGAGLFSATDIQAGNYARITERARALVDLHDELADD